MTDYNWSFSDFEVDAENKVKTIHWRFTAIDGEFEENVYGSCNGADMDFESMEKDTCKECVLESMESTEDELKADLDSKIEAKKNPETTIKNKEW